METFHDSSKGYGLSDYSDAHSCHKGIHYLFSVLVVVLIVLMPQHFYINCEPSINLEHLQDRCS